MTLLGTRVSTRVGPEGGVEQVFDGESMEVWVLCPSVKSGRSLKGRHKDFTLDFPPLRRCPLTWQQRNGYLLSVSTERHHVRSRRRKNGTTSPL